MNKAYITGSAVMTAVGKNKQESLSQMKSLDNSLYHAYRNRIFTVAPFYAIADKEDKKKRFYTIIKQVIFDALRDAGIHPDDYSSIPVFIGSTSMNISVSEQHWKEEGCFKHLGSGPISRYVDTLLDSETPVTIFSTACTSSANALIFAANEIKAGQLKHALVIGMEFFNDATFEGFKSLMLLSETGVYRPLSPQSDGIILGEGCSALVLSAKTKRKDDFMVLGSRDIFDNYSETSSNPDGKVIYENMVSALHRSAMTVEDLSLINIHSPGTELSNEAEKNALLMLLEENKRAVTLCSMKPYVGHTLGACSTNELVLLTSAITEGFIPKTLGVEDEGVFQYSDFQEVQNREATILFTYNGFSGNNFSFILSNQG